MPALSEYTNVYDTAVRLLRQKGFQVWRDRSLGLYGCERAGWDFLAESPVGLLGLVAIFESQRPDEYREYWWRNEQSSGDFAALPDEPRPYEPRFAVREKP